MSLEREDLRGRCDPAYKAALKAICNARGITEADFIESVVCREIEQIVHDAQAIAASAPVLGISAPKCDAADSARNSR